MRVGKAIKAILVLALIGFVAPAISAPSTAFLLAAGSCFHGELGVGYSCTNDIHPGAMLPPTIVPDLDPNDLIFLQNGGPITAFQWSNGTIGGMGDNRYGAMGPGTTADYIYGPIAIQYEGSILEGRQVEALYPGAVHMLAKLDNGSLVGWGSNYYGLLANGNFYENVVRSPVYSTEAQSFMPLNITCGGFNCYGLQDRRLIASWGDGDYCSLGWAGCDPGRVYLSVTTPITPWGEITEQNIEMLKVGAWYALALTDEGIVWSLGNSLHIGRSDNATIWLPINSTLIGSASESNNQIMDMHVGDQHSLLLTKDRRIFAFGHSYYGQLGNPIFNESYYYPYAIPTDMTPFDSDAVQHIYALSFSSLARTASGTIFVWGTYDYEWGYLPMIHPNYTQFISHHIYPSAGSSSAIFMIASNRPPSSGPGGSPSSTPSNTPAFSPSIVSVPAEPSTPTSVAPALSFIHSIFSILIALATFLAMTL